MNGEAQELTEEIRLDKYLAAIWRGKWLILIAVVISAGISAWVASRQQIIYTATALIRVGRVWKEPLQDAYTTKEIINSPGFSHELAEEIAIKPNELKRSIRAEVITAGPRRASYPILVRIVATAGSADQSTRLAQAVADEIISRHEDLFRLAFNPRLEQQHNLEERLSELTASGSASRDGIRQLEIEMDEIKARNSSPVETEKTRLINPVVAEGGARQPIWRNTLIAAMLGALTSIAAIMLLAFFKST